MYHLVDNIREERGTAPALYHKQEPLFFNNLRRVGAYPRRRVI